MVFQYTGAMPSSNIAHVGSLNLKGRDLKITTGGLRNPQKGQNLRHWNTYASI